MVKALYQGLSKSLVLNAKTFGVSLSTDEAHLITQLMETQGEQPDLRVKIFVIH